MKTITLVAIAFLGLSSCNNNDDETPLLAVESEQITNLHAPQNTDYTTNPPAITGDFVKFDFSTGATTTSDTDWDIAFRGTTIIVNGGESQGTTDEPNRTGNAGAYIVNNTFSGVTSIDESLFVQDSESSLAIATGSGNGWYTYAGPPSHLITPTAGKILVFKTHNGLYAKVEILSYYKDSPTNPNTSVDESRYFTFNYVYQPNENVTTFE